jgi:high-affinity nickel-transport protein
VLLGAAVLAYIFGLRHAVDADHIAAIDNVTRRLVHAGQRPTAAGLYFSLGHSAVVWLAAPGIALAAKTAAPRIEALHLIGGTLGAGISALFLLAIAVANLWVLRDIVRAIRRRRRGEAAASEALAADIAPRGFYARLLQPLTKMVSLPRHMLLVGVLFGLGFDTATEIGVLGISATAASGGLSMWSILLFPALFTVAMSLVDALDSALMTEAYAWARVDPDRKLQYNLAVTFLSVVAALTIGGVEIIGTWSGASGSLGSWLGYTIGPALAGLWLASLLFHRLRGWRARSFSSGTTQSSRYI